MAIDKDDVDVSTTFNDEQYTLPYAQGIECHFWTYARNRIIARHINAAIQHIDGARIMDVGCGTGVVVEYLRSIGLDCRGVELGEPTVVPAVAGFVQTGTDATQLRDEVREGMSAILLLDVVEHIEAPADFIEDLLGAYPNVKYLVITVPAREELWSNYDDYYGHFRRYTRRKVDQLAADCGLTVRTNRYFFFSLYFVLWSVLRVSKQRPLNINPPKGAVATAIHALAGSVFNLEEQLLPLDHLVGTSILAVLERQP